MPLGDSITKGGSSGESDPDKMISYRYALWELLVADGYDVDFVGSLNNGVDVFGSSDLADHEGHGGWYADEISDNIYDWLDNYTYTDTGPVNVVLLHIGTNDINFQFQDPPDIVNEVYQILDEIDQYEVNRGVSITVILALIINKLNAACGSGSTAIFNDDLYDMAMDRRKDKGDRIEIVDMECGANFIYQLQPDGNMYDELHPFETGYVKMAGSLVLRRLSIGPAGG